MRIGAVSLIGFVEQKYPQRTVEDKVKYGKYVLVEMDVDPRLLPAKLTAEERIEVGGRRIEAGLRLRLTGSGIAGPLYVGADYLDLTQRSPERPEGIYYQRDSHLNADGHQYVADAIVEWASENHPELFSR